MRSSRKRWIQYQAREAKSWLDSCLVLVRVNKRGEEPLERLVDYSRASLSLFLAKISHSSELPKLLQHRLHVIKPAQQTPQNKASVATLSVSIKSSTSLTEASKLESQNKTTIVQLDSHLFEIHLNALYYLPPFSRW